MKIRGRLYDVKTIDQDDDGGVVLNLHWYPRSKQTVYLRPTSTGDIKVMTGFGFALDKDEQSRILNALEEYSS